MNQQTCIPERLDAFLQNELSDFDELQLTQHLDECAECRDELESRAAEQAEWQEASRLLGGTNQQSASVIGDHRTATVCSPQIQQILQQLAPTDDPASLGRIGGYEVTGVIGSGGMGVVLKAHDRSLDRVVAIKVMSPHLASSGSARQRFAREAKAAAAVLHPNVIAIHGVSNDQSLPYLVMPYVRGASLQKRIDAEGPLPTIDILRIGSQVAAGLAAAHEQGLVHRDIKPANILLEQGVERVAITDFGLARAVDDASMTRSGVIAGTPQYMSPEQARGEAIDARSDLFSLGSLLYAMCTGHSPFRAETSYGVLHRITHDAPRAIRELNPNIPEWLEKIVMKLLSKSREDRFGSSEEVSDLLEGCLAHLQHPMTTPLPAVVDKATNPVHPQHSGTRRFVHSRKLIAAAFAFVAFAGVLIVLETNKGTLNIQCEADDVPIRIKQGDKVVEQLTVSQAGKSIRIAAGNYVVEIDQPFDGTEIAGGQVSLKRGDTETVRITMTESEKTFVSSDNYLAHLPDGRSLELVGITQNNQPASEGWKPNGQQLDNRLGEWHPDVVLGGNARDFLFRLNGLKDVPSLRFSLPGRGAHYTFLQPEQLPGPWQLRVGGSLEDIPKLHGQFLRQETGVVQVAYTDDAWGDWVQISAADGRILNPLAETAKYYSEYEEIKVRGVAALSAESAPKGLPASPVLTLFQTLRHSQMNDFSIRGIDSAGEEVWLTTRRIPLELEKDRQFPEERTWRLGESLPGDRTLSRFEFRLRPYRYLVTFENVVTDEPTKKPSEVKVSVETIGVKHAAEDRVVEPDTSNTDLDRIQGAWQTIESNVDPSMPMGRPHCPVSFLGSRMAISAPQRAVSGTFKLSIDTDPKQIDCQLGIGDKRVDLIGIYEFRENQLWLCLTEGRQRPTSFEESKDVVGLLFFILERQHVDLPNVDSDDSLALSDWTQKQDGAGVFATYSLSIPGIEPIMQGLAAGKAAFKEFSGLPEFPESVFKLRYYLPNLSPRGMEFVARNGFHSSINLIELSQVAKGKRLLKVFSYPDSSPGASETSLKPSVLAVGADQADWLEGINATGDIIYGYEIVLSNTKPETDDELTGTTKPQLTYPNRWQTSPAAVSAPSIDAPVPDVAVYAPEGIVEVNKTVAIDLQNARSVVEAYVALALAADVPKAAALAKNTAADPDLIQDLPEILNVQRLKIPTVYVNDPAKPMRALATSEALRLIEEHKNPDGRRDGFLVFTLECKDGNWSVIDIDVETEPGAEKELKRFLEASPNSVGLPPQP